MNDDTLSTGTYSSEKTDMQRKMIKDVSNDQIELIGDNIGHLSKKDNLIANFCTIGENKKQFFAKEIDKKHNDTPAKLAIAQAFYSMIVHTPAIYGRKQIKGKDCIIYQKINIENAGNDNCRMFWNWFDKHIKTYYQMHSLLYGIIDRPKNTMFIIDRNSKRQICGIDINSNGYKFFAFNKACLPSYKEDEDYRHEYWQYRGNDFLHAKRSRLEIVKEECKKLANFDYDEFLHRCVRNFQILGIEQDRGTWRTFLLFLFNAFYYKRDLMENYADKDRVKKASGKYFITKLKDNLLGYGDEYEAPQLIKDALTNDFDNFTEFNEKIEADLLKDSNCAINYTISDPYCNVNISKNVIDGIINEYGDNYRKAHPKSNVNNVQSTYNFDNFYASTRGFS